MTKCGKGCMPECEYFTTGGCISPFNCPYKTETGYINSAMSTLDNLTDLLIEFDEMGFCPTTLCEDPEKYAIEWKTRLLKELNKNKIMLMPEGYIKQLYRGEEIEKIVKEREEYKHRAEVAERALKKFAENITCEDCPFFSDCASSEKMEDLIHSNYCFAEYLKQAEKELQEERKDD